MKQEDVRPGLLVRIIPGFEGQAYIRSGDLCEVICLGDGMLDSYKLRRISDGNNAIYGHGFFNPDPFLNAVNDATKGENHDTDTNPPAPL